MTKRQLKPHLVSCILLFLLLAACNALPPNPAPPTFVPPSLPTSAPRSVIEVTRGSITHTVAARGRVAAVREVNLSFPVQGALKALSIQAGQQVKQGEVLAELDAWDLEMSVFTAQSEADSTQVRLTQARATQAQQIAAAQANLNVVQAQAAASAANREFRDRQIQQGKVTHGSREEFEIIALRLEAALDEARLAEAQAKLQSARVGTDPSNSVPMLGESLRLAKARLERLQARLETTKLRAPFDGVVVSLNARVGDGLDAYQPIGIVADPSQLTVIANVFESDVYDISVGQTATVKLDASPDRVMTGKVSKVALQPITWQGKSAYEIAIAFDDPASLPGAIRQGADVTISAHPRSNVLLVPNNAITTKGSQTYADLIEGNTTQQVQVQLGVSDGANSEVLYGLREGDTVKIP